MRELNNKLIAEFMGGIPSSVPNLINLPQTIGQSSILCVRGSEGLPSGTFKVERINELEYDTSWKWLMPVVDKIECTPIDNDDNSDNFFNVMIEVFECNINGGGICICESGHTKRDATYKAVVEFIKWYNNQSK